MKIKIYYILWAIILITPTVLGFFLNWHENNLLPKTHPLSLIQDLAVCLSSIFLVYCAITKETNTGKLYLTLGILLVFVAISMILIREWLITENLVIERLYSTTIATLIMASLGLLMCVRGKKLLNS